MAKPPSEPPTPVRRPARPPATQPPPAPTIAIGSPDAACTVRRIEEVFAEPPRLYVIFAQTGAIVGMLALAQSLATPDTEREIDRLFQTAAVTATAPAMPPPVRHLRLEP